MTQQRYQTAIAAFDKANSEDPNKEMADGKEYPKELLYAQRMSEMQERFAPDASEAVKLAVRAQHIRRWEIPRERYPMDRIGYLKWRTDLKHLHAKLAGGILEEAGYGAETIARVQALLKKEQLKQDPEAQTLEDTACLVFLENYFADFAKGHDPDKVISILRKTWKKMSPQGQEMALGLKMTEAARALVEKALAGPES